jgi:hypothetical protein
MRAIGFALAASTGAILGCALVTLIARWFR